MVEPLPIHPGDPPEKAEIAPFAERIAMLGRALAGLASMGRSGPDLFPLSFGVGSIDRILGGGLARALHEIASAAEGDAPAATGFAVALLVCAAHRNKPLIWIRDHQAGWEDGAPYGPGLAAFGLDPAQIVFVLAPDATAALASMEQALRSGAFSAALGEVRGQINRAKWGLASRRLSLAAQRGATPALLLRAGDGERLLAAPIAAVTRWRISALASAAAPANGIGPPRFAAELVRNRRGPTASFFLEWRPHERVFLPLPALCERVVPPAFDRPDRAQVCR